MTKPLLDLVGRRAYEWRLLGHTWREVGRLMGRPSDVTKCAARYARRAGLPWPPVVIRGLATAE